MIPQLTAEEAFHDSNVIAVGTGSMKKEDRARVVRGWRSVSRQDVQRVSAEHKRFVMASIGIKVN